jgi:hypothetical protein
MRFHWEKTASAPSPPQSSKKALAGNPGSSVYTITGTALSAQCRLANPFQTARQLPVKVAHAFQANLLKV